MDYKCYIKSHGKFQVELKIRYPVTDKKNKYSLDLYIFSPKVLAVNNISYGINSFLRDVRIMTRISTPELSFPRLVSKDCPESPLFRIKTELEKSFTGIKIKNNKVIYELRTLANIIRVELRKNRLFLRNKIDSETDIDLLTEWLTEFINHIRIFLLRFREIKSMLINPEIDDSLLLAYEWTDESISLTIQREAGEFYRLCQKNTETEYCSVKFANIIEGEIQHRIEKAYSTGIPYPEKKSTGELLIYRTNLLKKWSQSAMYLNVTGSRSPARIMQILAGTAAAIAMAFAVTATILTDRFFPANTTAWALAAVVAYIFKDRIKEILRSGLKSLVPRRMPDQMSILKDSSVQVRTGYTKSFINFTTEANIPEEIKNVRGTGKKPFRELLPEENIINFRHEVMLNGAKFSKNHQRMESVTEIIRFELHKFIQLMDDPDQIYYYTDSESVQKKMCRRVYHLNFVIMLQDLSDGKKSFLKYRIILNRDGIIRIERPAIESQ